MRHKEILNLVPTGSFEETLASIAKSHERAQKREAKRAAVYAENPLIAEVSHNVVGDAGEKHMFRLHQIAGLEPLPTTGRNGLRFDLLVRTFLSLVHLVMEVKTSRVNAGIVYWSHISLSKSQMCGLVALAPNVVRTWRAPTDVLTAHAKNSEDRGIWMNADGQTFWIQFQYDDIPAWLVQYEVLDMTKPTAYERDELLARAIKAAYDSVNA